MAAKHITLFLVIIICVVLSIFGAYVMATSSDVKLYWYQQQLDHFVARDERTNVNFQQRVYVDWAYRDGRANEDGMPILVYLGGEASMDNWVGGGGIVTLAASRFHALVVYIEHRFYGESIPLGSINAAMLDPYIRGCLTTDQALADFAEIILSLKSNWSLPHSPVIVFGGSYAGVLAARFRMKYPNIAIGALASSAPILNSEYLPPEKQYCFIVSRDFENENEKCYQYISQSWGLIDQIASQPGGLDTLSRTFSTCGPLIAAYELKGYLAGTYAFAAQYNGKFGQIPQLCNHISGVSEDNILKGIGDGVLALHQPKFCTNITAMPPKSFSVIDSASASSMAWGWQVCNEFVPRQGCSAVTMFERSSFNLSAIIEACFYKYGTCPHLPWNSTNYGGQDLKTILKKSASNIIFSNGLMDPYSGGGILEDISQTIVAITTKEGSHCLDMTSEEDDDPKWLKDQREKEFKIIAHWINVTWSSSNGLSVWATWHSLLIALIVTQFIV